MQWPGKTRSAPVQTSRSTERSPTCWPGFMDTLVGYSMVEWAGRRESEEVVFTVARQHPGLLSKASLLGSFSPEETVPKSLPASQWCTRLKIQASNESHTMHVTHKYQHSHKLGEGGTPLSQRKTKRTIRSNNSTSGYVPNGNETVTPKKFMYCGIGQSQDPKRRGNPSV